MGMDIYTVYSKIFFMLIFAMLSRVLRDMEYQQEWKKFIDE